MQCLYALGGAGPLLTLSWHSFPHYISSEKGMHHTTPPHRSKWGVLRSVGLFERLPTWKYHIPVLSGGPVCNCVLSDLQSPSHSFVPDIFLQWIYFSFFGILAAVPLVTKFRSFLSPCVLWANDKSVWKLHFVWKEKKKKSYPHQGKGHIEQPMNGQTHQCCIRIWFIVLDVPHSKTFGWEWKRNTSVIHLQDQTYHEAILCDQSKPRMILH